MSAIPQPNRTRAVVIVQDESGRTLAAILESAEAVITTSAYEFTKVELSGYAVDGMTIYENATPDDVARQLGLQPKELGR